MKFVPEIYQDRGIDFLADSVYKGDPPRALFAGCGLGKTAMTLGASDRLFRDGALKGLLVVAPIRVCNITWPSEVALWDEFSWMTVANLRTKEGMEAWMRGKAHIYTINYEALPMFSHKYLVNKKRKDLPACTVVYDELSKAKNHASVRINDFRRHWEKFERHWGLTGTPSPNSRLDLFAQYRLLDNGKRLGTAFTKFRQQYFYAVDRDQMTWQLMKGQENIIEQLVQDMTLVLKSSDWLKIEDTEVIDIEVSLPDNVKAMYKKLSKELLLLIDQHKINAVNAAVLVNKLTQLTSGAIYTGLRESVNLITGEIEMLPSETVILHDHKLKAVRQIFKEQRGKPLMVAYQYKHEEERLRKEFPQAVCFSDAKTPKQQDEIADAWNAQMIPMLIVSPSAAGHGLNLQFGGTDIVWFSLNWSRELYDQLNARLARKGQLGFPRIFRLLCSKTIDEAVAETLRKKGDDQTNLMDAIANFKLLNAA